MKAAQNDLRFAGVISKVEDEIAREWCRMYPGWVSKENSPRTANYVIDAKDSNYLSNLTGHVGLFNGTMVYAVTGRVSATEWNYGSGQGYKVKYVAHLNLKAVWVDDDGLKRLNDRLAGAASIQSCIEWIKKEYGPAQLADVQKAIQNGCPF